MKRLHIISALLLFISATGCKKYLDINTNPSVPQVASAELLLPPIIYQMTNGTAQDYRIVWKMTQDMVSVNTATASIVWEQHGFPLQSDVGGVIWRMTYADLGLNLENMINDAVANQKYEYAGIGYAVKAWAYQMTTDMHGPIILDEAFDPTRLRFPYRDQPEVYAKVREWGNTAIKYLNMTSPVSQAATLAGPSGDYMYKGNKEKWKKFVYALFALQYSHLINKPEFPSQYADSVIKYVDLSFVNESESATVGFNATSASDSNPLGPAYGYLMSSTSYYGRPSTTIVQYLTGGLRGTPATEPTSSVDPRLSRMLPQSNTTATLGRYIGVQPTSGTAPAGSTPVYGPLPAGSSVYNGKYIFANAARYPLMTYSQLQMAKAEALFYKGDKPSAYTAYINAIRGHVDFINTYGRASTTPDPIITTAEINTYLASSEIPQTATDLTIADIMGQKYIIQWGWAGLEQWSDIRKYHYDPAVYRQFYQIPPDVLNTPGKYAYRVRPRYNSEYVWNAEELDKWGGLAPDYMTKETWFSQP
jgi:Tfp pilus assembly protein PilX